MLPKSPNAGPNLKLLYITIGALDSMKKSLNARFMIKVLQGDRIDRHLK